MKTQGIGRAGGGALVQLALRLAVVMIFASAVPACGSSRAIGAGSSAGGSATPQFAFQPITIQRIDLPDGVTSAKWPVFTNDGQHLLFWVGNELWITGLDGSQAHCLSCGLANDPQSKGEKLSTPFPDGKRVFFGGYVQPGSAQMAVLECTPSVVDCTSASVLPVDFSGAEPPIIPAGGAVQTPQLNLAGSSTPKLSQDGEHVGFSDMRADCLLCMLVAKLVRTADKYQLSDARVINPPGPVSSADTSVEHWSQSAALHEFKTFANGGADATYVESGGGGSLLNPDVWSVNLATGRRTRLTSHPDWEEDNAVSPNGKLLAVWSNRTMHFTDWLGGLVPVRDFIDAPAAAMAAAAIGANKKCHGPMWILPSSGDAGGTLAGQPIVDYRDPDVFVTNNLDGWPMWSPDGTMLALNTQSIGSGSDLPYMNENGAPYLLVAHFTALAPSRPIATVSSEVGSWAPAPTDYHGAMGHDGKVTLNGPGGGTVTITYAGLSGALAGLWSETYKGYSDNGVDFLDGAVHITGTAIGGSYAAHLTMSGIHSGTQDANLILSSRIGPIGLNGHAQSSYDGNSIDGPSAEQVQGGACPEMMPKKPALQVAATDLGHHVYRIRVTASIAGVGTNEAAVDIEPVYHASLQLGGATTYTDIQGVATVTVAGSHELSVTAGDTLEPASLSLP